MNNSEKQPLLTPIMRWFMFAMVLANIAGTMIPMFVPIYLTELGASVEQVGMVFTLSSIVILFLLIFGGWLSDSIGRLRAIAIGSVGGIIGWTFMILAPSWQWMLVALSINQIPYALVGPSFRAFIAENSKEEHRGRVFGITDTIYQITGVVGPPLGGLLAGTYGFKAMLLTSGILYTMAAGLRIWMATTMKSPQEENPQKLTAMSFKSSVKTMFGMLVGGGVITWIFITDGVRDTAFRLSGELQPLYLERIAGISVEQIGILGAIFSIAMMFTPMLSGKLVDKYEERVPIALGFGMVFAAFVYFLQATTFIGFAVTWVIYGTGVGLLSPAYSSLMTKVVPQKMLGIFMGLFFSSIGLISLPAPWIGAQLWERYSPRLPFVITAGAALLTLIPVLLKFKVPERKEELAFNSTD
jgi:MFS family permease